MADVEDLDDLPAISLNSSISDVTVSFEMPDARTVAAQRKLALEQEAEIKKYKEEMPLDIVEDPVSPEIIKQLKKSVPAVTMPQENPGIFLNELNRMDVIDKFEGPRSALLLDLMEKVPQCSDRALSGVLTWYLDSIERTVKEAPESIESDDIHCNVVALSLVALDKHCRDCVEMSRLQAVLMELLNRTGRPHQSQVFLSTLTEHLLRIIPHFHDRLVLSQLFNNANVCPKSLQKPEYCSTKLAMALTIASITDILGYTKPVVHENLTETDLKDIMVNGTRWHSMNPYEQYIMMLMLMNLLKTYALMNDGSDEALQELMLIISTMKSNEKWNNGEFLKVKNLIAKTKLFVQSKRVQDFRNPGNGDGN